MLPVRDDVAAVEQRGEERQRRRRSPCPNRAARRSGCSSTAVWMRRVRAVDRAHREGDADLLARPARSPATISGRPRGCRRSAARSCRRDALHMPLPFVSYFEPFIAAFAFATLPWSPGVPYGLYSASWLLNSVSGTMWFAIGADRRAAPRLRERRLVDDPVHRLADVDVVERRLRQVHRQVPGAVARVLEEVAASGSASVAYFCSDLRRDARGRQCRAEPASILL